ncbi:MAG: hypothetical protein ACFFBP_01975 [Promethearchaeota archaeon]
MPREVKGIILSRLFVLMAIIAVPIIIFLVFIFTPFDVWWTLDVKLDVFIAKFLTPFTFSVSWLYFLILFANRFSITIDSMEKTINIIPLRLKIFYGINAMFILFIFGFPLVTPIISILSFASMVWQLTTIRKKNWDEKSKAPKITLILMAISAFLPVFCTVSIALDYLKLPIFLGTLWITFLIDNIYTFSYCLCTSLAIGSLFILLANRGVSEYEQFLVEPRQEKTFFYIAILEIGLLVFFLFLAFNEEIFPIINFFYYTGFVIVLLVSVVNYFSGKNQSKKFSSHVFGYILAAIFMGSNLIIGFSPEISDFMRNTSLIILATIFILVFLYTFMMIEE